ncbi:DedA family protein [Pelagibacteraceae bacterium]|jgi:membrane protein YqaA with SNARE-associated domain|nr:DedA family protein [Pelagibacteraceae bacterium]|tara:strand:+ start:3914 stop:4510 length:597 start_codon:yes stop_codon:yes gene_type:complete
MLQNLYFKCVQLARHRYSKHFLAFIAFIESSFFPIPPDVMIAPMVVAKKEEYLKIFIIATIFSVLGGLLGYFFGFFFLEVSISLIEFYGYEEKVYTLQDKLSSGNGVLLWLGTLFLAGFTPLPFKVFTITSGIIHFNILIFVIVCFVSRGLRFFLVSYFSMKFGEKFGESLEKNGATWFTVTGIVIIIIAITLYFYIK